QASHRSGEADRDHAVEQPDVDAELESVRRRDAEQLTRDELALDLPPLRGRVAGPVRREPTGVVGSEPVESEAMNELRGLPALGEDEGPEPARDELGAQARAVPERARAHPELLVDERRAPQ